LSMRCGRCFQKNPSQFAKIPCIRCGKDHLYCRHCIEMGRIMACESLYYWSGKKHDWKKHKAPCSWDGIRTPIQKEAASRIVESIEQSNQLVIWAVTGSGKTEMLFPGITRALQKGLRVCIASPRADVIRELLPRLQLAFQSVTV